MKQTNGNITKNLIMKSNEIILLFFAGFILGILSIFFEIEASKEHYKESVYIQQKM